jgi:type I restriction enzyme R subunit
MLRESLVDEEDVDLDDVVLSHYRLSAIQRQDFKLQEDVNDYKLEPGDGVGTAKARNKKEELLSQLITRLNELFITDNLTENDIVNYA